MRRHEPGLLVTINTDDPAMTDLDIGREYQAVAEAQGFDLEELGWSPSKGSPRPGSTRQIRRH